ncbi:hypothetical protein LshimejAT787_0201650 [Lyophyllum shimeji]|uniref:Uncharacterized protein n=1 Tax=Lyophyllum shimeji TaxID=47721 RepID=A0A9P3UKL1_LYOSH|nr:hypothetical protein LshimejAT787_0201650 [Lyophyllum shimeji]
MLALVLGDRQCHRDRRKAFPSVASSLTYAVELAPSRRWNPSFPTASAMRARNTCSRIYRFKDNGLVLFSILPQFHDLRRFTAWHWSRALAVQTSRETTLRHF